MKIQIVREAKIYKVICNTKERICFIGETYLVRFYDRYVTSSKDAIKRFTRKILRNRNVFASNSISNRKRKEDK